MTSSSNLEPKKKYCREDFTEYHFDPKKKSQQTKPNQETEFLFL